MLTQEDETIIKGLHAKGWSDAAIAIKMGVSEVDVALTLKEVKRKESATARKS